VTEPLSFRGVVDRRSPIRLSRSPPTGIGQPDAAGHVSIEVALGTDRVAIVHDASQTTT